MILSFCVACGSTESLENHHLVPKSLGGSDGETNLITLCSSCHGKAHGIIRKEMGKLVKEGMKRAKEKGVKFGNPNNLKYVSEKSKKEARKKGLETCKSRANQYAITMYPIIVGLRNDLGSFQKVANELNSRGVLAIRGGLWTSSQVKRIIDRIDK